jgi:UDP-glucuronate 4-epimerase
MAPFQFVRAILEDRPLKVFNYGNHRRDFTYIDDIIEGVVRVLDHPAESNPAWKGDHPDPASSAAPWRVYNIGNSQPVQLMDYIAAFEEALGKTTGKEMLPLQPGDMPDTYADVADLKQQFDYKPDTPVKEGVRRFVEWYQSYYSI